VFPFIARLDAYPGWLPLVHAAEPVGEQPKPAWLVELRTRIGPLARSKRLTMQRQEIEHDQFVVFERAETDGREHARWALRAELRPIGAGETELTMHLAYDGALWTGGLLEKVLDEEIRRGRAGLVELVSAERTR
jgi:hypothetical protein